MSMDVNRPQKIFGNMMLFLMVLGVLYNGIHCQTIQFDSGEAFTAINSSTVAGASDYTDPKDTGSYLFQSDTSMDQKALSLSVLVAHFRSASSFYFRTHPTFITCLQATISSLRKQDLRVDIISAFKTNSDVPGSNKIQDLYARSGTGATLKFRPGVLGDIRDIADTAIKMCASMFSVIQRDVGVVLMMSSVHIFMTGNLDTTPQFSVDGYTGGMSSADFHTYAMTKLGEANEPAVIPTDCSAFSSVVIGAKFPSSATDAESVVGDPDTPILRENTEDFSRLTQYMGTKVDFVNHERTSAWCGSVGQPCVDCRAGIVGSALTQRCAARTMSYRMYKVFNILQKFVRYNMTFDDTLRVVKAWDEPYADATGGDLGYSRLHTEGRAVVVQLVSANTGNNLEEVSHYAICAGADYISHQGDSLQIAVKKMSGTTEKKTAFQLATFIAVDPPTAKATDYEFPPEFTEEDKENYPLFYGKGRGHIELAEGAFLHQFMSSDDTYQYFRLHPSIPACYSNLLVQLNRATTDGEVIDLEVIRGYLADPEQPSLFSQATDDRYNTHTLGVAMQLKFAENTSSNYTSAYLLEEIVKTCGPLFNLANEAMGLGLYSDSVFVDMRDLFEVWIESDSLIPYQGMDFNAYDNFLETLHTAAIGEFYILQGFRLSNISESILFFYILSKLPIDIFRGRIVDPDDPVEACNLAVIPTKQSPTYLYQLPEILNRRRKRSTPTDVCTPDDSTSFCVSTVSHRNTESELVWTDMNRHYIYHQPSSELYDAIKGCLNECGTCLEGSIYERKHTHCSNMVHWMPYPMLNDDYNVTNFFSRDKTWSKELACFLPGHHCIHKAPAYAKLAPHAYRIYRPDPQKAQSEELYSKEDNPSPLMSILEETYAINAKGKVTFWVEDEVDIKAMEVPLKTVMLYNHDVTLVVIYVRNTISINAVAEVVESFIENMATTGCTLYTRKILAPYSIDTVPASHLVKRDTSNAVNSIDIEYMVQWQRDELAYINHLSP
ncbi:uncharacterized protein LOC117339972 [Pecten maximus]|uniref:uncharacterized protein LOC117339972 n=1 Tax=Pecten maximus TaxID=6579 RepID=UPI0014585BC2|nr:uncharacterized protein LOC117339972 [Pecten maximus]